MQKNVLEYLLNTADKTPVATAYVDEDKHLTFREVVDLSKIIGKYIKGKIVEKILLLLYFCLNLLMHCLHFMV